MSPVSNEEVPVFLPHRRSAHYYRGLYQSYQCVECAISNPGQMAPHWRGGLARGVARFALVVFGDTHPGRRSWNCGSLS